MKRAIVTGGARGIGLAIVKALQAEDIEVVTVDLAPDPIEAILRSGQPAAVCDVSDFEAVESTFSRIERLYGPVDILINNAGITRDGMVHKMDPIGQWQAVLAVNLTSAFNTVRVLAPGMRSRGWGRIVNISSITAQRGQVGQANYAAAKAGLIGFTKSIALELAPKGVCANAVAPGFIETSMTAAMPADVLAHERSAIPIGRLGQPSDIAGVVAFLVSEAAAFVTGQVFGINGGQYM